MYLFADFVMKTGGPIIALHESHRPETTNRIPRSYDITIYRIYEVTKTLRKVGGLAYFIAIYGYIGGWGVLNREAVASRSCVRARGLVA